MSIIQDEVRFEQMLADQAAFFEAQLKNQKDLDPLKRCKARRDFYLGQEDLRKQRSRTIGTRSRVNFATNTVEKFKFKWARNREYEANLPDKLYSGPVLAASDLSTEEIQHNMEILAEQERMTGMIQNKKRTDTDIVVDGHVQPKTYRMKMLEGRPVFLGEDGTLYDVNYLPIVEQEVHREFRGRVSRISQREKIEPTNDEEEELERILCDYEFSRDLELFQNMPSPDIRAFRTFEDYEHALLRWKQEVQQKLGYLQLPRYMGRAYYRPTTDVVKDTKSIKGEVPLHRSDSHDKDDEMEQSWDSHLVPFEPKPEFYDTYEQYEKAMVRWGAVCLGLPFMPPHASQFEELSNLKPSKRREAIRTTAEGTDTDGYEEHVPVDDGTVKVSGASTVEKLAVGNEWDKMSKESVKKLSEALDNLVTEKKKQIEKYRRYHRDLVPHIHGRFHDESDLMRRLPLSQLQLVNNATDKQPSTIRDWVREQREERSIKMVNAVSTMPFLAATADDLEHQKPLRRTDLTQEQLCAGRDCEEVEQGRKVEFTTPEFDLAQVDFDMFTNEHYMRFLRVIIARADSGHRYDHLTSHNFPREIITNEYSVEMSRVVQAIQHPLQITPQHVRTIFSAKDVYVDTFTSWLSDKLADNIPMVVRGKQVYLETNMELLLASMSDVKNLHAVLSLFRDCDSNLVHAKVALFIQELMKTERAGDHLLTFIKDNDIDMLHWVTHAVTFFDEVPIGLYTYSEECRYLVKQTFSESVNQFLQELITAYYVDCISISLLEEEKEFPHVYPLLLDHFAQMIDAMARQLENKQQAFLSHDLWALVGNRCDALSQIGGFALGFLFFLSRISERIMKLLQSDNTKLVYHFRKLASSKISHVQQTITRIFPTLQQRQWRSMLTTVYSSPENVISDLIYAAQRTALDSQPPLISSMVLEFIGSALDQMDPNDEMIVGLIRERAFQKVLRQVLLTFEQMRLQQGTIQGALFLARFAKHLVQNQQVTVHESQKKAQTSSSANITKALGGLLRRQATTTPVNEESVSTGPKLELIQAELSQMFAFVRDTENYKNKKIYRARTKMLETLRHLIKCPAVQAALIQEDKFFQQLVVMCQDHHDMDFNRNAWKMFYQMVKLYPKTVETLISSNLLHAFLDQIGGSESSITTTNALRYFNKIFELVNLDVNEVTKKQYADTVKRLCDHIVSKELFGVFHLAYNKLITEYNGWPFQNLAKLYHTLNTNKSCEKLVIAMRKKDQSFRDGLDTMAKMLGEEPKTTPSK